MRIHSKGDSRCQPGRRKDRLGTAAACCLLAFALAAPLVMTPADLPSWTICLFRRVTGLLCPLCGLSHALLAAGRGHWVESVAFHPLGPLVWAITIGLLLADALSRFSHTPRPRLRTSHAVAAASTVMLVWMMRLVAGALGR